MRKSVNKVFLMGHLGAAPELQMSKAGRPYCRLSVATHNAWMNQEDKREERTDWHSVFVWGATAERCVQNLEKGALVYVEGALTYWQVAQKKEYRNAIHGFDVKFLNSPRSASGADSGEDLDNPEGARNHIAVAHPA